MTDKKWYTRRDWVVIGLIAIIIVLGVARFTSTYDAGHEAGYDVGYEERRAFEAIKWNRWFNMLEKERAATKATIESLEWRLEEEEMRRDHQKKHSSKRRGN